MWFRGGLKFSLVFILTLALASCESVEEKAEKHYQRSLELVEAGEPDRAIVELKSVFSLNGEHRDARMLYASLVLENNDIKGAFGHYLLVSEQYPDDIEARLKLIELAIRMGAWQEAERHAEAAKRLDPDNNELEPLLIVVDYSVARRADDEAVARREAKRAVKLLAESPDNVLVRQVVLDNLINQQKFDEALEAVQEGLARDPSNRQLNDLRLGLLARLEDSDAVGDQLKAMVERFPDDRDIRTSLVQWYLSNDDVDAAENFVRSLVARSGDEIQPRVALVQFLKQVRGTDAAIAELNSLVDEGLDNDKFRLLRASLLFDDGKRDQAIEQVQTLIEGREPSDETRKAKTTLAQMLVQENEKSRANDIVEDVLKEDPKDTNALKMKANWLIEEDKVRDAVLALRTALDQDPRDAATISLMARAYERGGNRELMAESLGLAYETSNAGATESLRYARYLTQSKKFTAAEDVLLKAMRMSPGNLDILRMLGSVYLEMNDLPRADQVVSSLRGMGTPEGDTIASSLEATILQRSQRTDESIELMQSMIREGQGGLAAQAAIIRTHLANGELGAARTFMDELLEDANSEDRPGVSFLNAALLATEGEYEKAEGIYRNLLRESPKSEPVWRALISTLAREGNRTKAELTVDKALAELPESTSLLWIKAGLAEQNGKIDDAIKIYQKLYQQDSNSTIIANNLASLLATYREDEESLERAFMVARRLRGTEVPAFQDTYGWIAYRLKNFTEAQENLEPAAQSLPNDPAVQYHLAKTYLGLKKFSDAEMYFDKALELWNDDTGFMAEDSRREMEALRRSDENSAAAEFAQPSE